jgi:hypothetical protein
LGAAPLLSGFADQVRPSTILFGVVAAIRMLPLITHVIRALWPVFVFALKQVDGRMKYSRRP